MFPVAILSVCPKQTMLISWSFVLGYWKTIQKTIQEGGEKKYVMQRECVIFFFWFGLE